ncbi:MAG: IMCp domain-containing protein [Nitrososphaera sp.]|jgi:hypothetical protein
MTSHLPNNGSGEGSGNQPTKANARGSAKRFRNASDIGFRGMLVAFAIAGTIAVLAIAISYASASNNVEPSALAAQVQQPPAAAAPMQAAPKIIEKPVYIQVPKYINRTIDKPVYINRTVEVVKTVPIYVNHTITKPVFVDRVVEKPVYINRTIPIEHTVMVYVNQPAAQQNPSGPPPQSPQSQTPASNNTAPKQVQQPSSSPSPSTPKPTVQPPTSSPPSTPSTPNSGQSGNQPPQKVSQKPQPKEKQANDSGLNVPGKLISQFKGSFKPVNLAKHSKAK